MPPLRLGPRDLLEYDARYSVLICQECRYAIQKSALRSHLLRHKIYRDERHRLLSSIAQLDLCEPDEVPFPVPASPPIDGLPVVSGYRCVAVRCDYLCASIKRIRHHIREEHSTSDPASVSSLAKPAKLQTFFRGTKLRYFEVTPSDAKEVHEPLSHTVENSNDEKPSDEDEHDDRMYGLSTATPPTLTLLEGAPPLPDAWFRPSLVDLDLEILTYFHHYTTTTSRTLPVDDHSQVAKEYWSTDVVTQALRQRLLMYGLLAISAYHLFLIEENTTIRRLHSERSTQFHSAFTAGWEERTKTSLSIEVLGDQNQMRKAGHQLGCFLQCARWALAGSILEKRAVSEPTCAFSLHSIMATVRSFIVSERRPLDENQSYQNNHRGETFARASKIIESRISSGDGISNASPYDGSSLVLLDRLCALPSRMTEAFGRPENLQDVLDVLSAIAILVECCENAFAYDDTGAAWQAMVTWLCKVPDRFHDRVSQENPAALVVVAHWALLVERAEQRGSWFLKGSGRKIILYIMNRIPTDDFTTRGLLEDLTS